MTQLELARTIVKVIDEKKGEDIKLLDIHAHTTIGDYFIIATGQNVPQVKAIADAVDEKLSALGLEARSFEGYQTADWILMDYGTIIVHLFRGEIREFYSLERLWRDAPEVDISDIVEPA